MSRSTASVIHLRNSGFGFKERRFLPEASPMKCCNWQKYYKTITYSITK